MPRSPSRTAAEWVVPAVVALMLVALGVWLIARSLPRAPRPPVPAPAPAPLPPQAGPPAEGYLFCHWNVENLFDDEDDPRLRDDAEDWFGRDPEALRQKLDHLADALLRQNAGRGPDILALVEVENRRAVELLQRALNARLPTEDRYTGIAHRDNRTGRRIEPAVLTRLSVRDDPPAPPRRRKAAKDAEADDPHDFGIRRILEAHLEADGAPLVVLVAHWTSRVRGREESDEKREAYADALYAAFLDLYRRNPAVDLLICGDFNDEPADPSVRDHLHALPVRAFGRARAGGGPPPLWNLAADLDPARDGTYFYSGRWQILDHLVVAPGLLDRSGWTVLPETFRTVNDPFLRSGRNRAPWRFGQEDHPNPRGYSDHFALSVRLRVVPARAGELR